MSLEQILPGKRPSAKAGIWPFFGIFTQTKSVVNSHWANFLESMDSMVVGTLFTGSEVPLQMLEARERPIAGTTFERSFLFSRVLHHDHERNIEQSMQA